MDPQTFSLSTDNINLINNGLLAKDIPIDERIAPFLYMSAWKLYTKYKGHRVDIPKFWGSSFHLVKYFQVVKKPGDPFYDENEEENEIGCTIWAGWKGYDHECEINLFISGENVLNGVNKVSAEILKTGSAKMVLTLNHNRITAFREKSWLGTKHHDKVWIDDLNSYL